MSSTANITERFLEMNKQSLIFKALRVSEPGNKRGNISKCWKLDLHTLNECACMHIMEHKSGSTIYEELEHRFVEAGVQKRSLDTWLRQIRKAYGVQQDAYLSNVSEAESIAFASGDLTAVLGVTMSQLAPRFITWGKGLDLSECTKDEHNTLLRFMDTQIKAAEVQAKARHNEALTERVLQKLREQVKIVGDDKRAPLDREQAQKRIAELVDEAMGIKKSA